MVSTVAPKKRSWIPTAIIVAGIAATAWAVSKAGAPDPRLAEDPDYYSVGRLSPGQCMSGPMAAKRANDMVDRIDWTKVEGAATLNLGLKLMITQVKLFAEMQRLGTQPCPDLRPLYERWTGASH